MTDPTTIARECKHNFIRITRTTWDRPVPHWKCSKCGAVRTELERMNDEQ